MTYDQLNHKYEPEVIRKVIAAIPADELSMEKVIKGIEEYVSSEEYANERKAKLNLIESNKRERARRFGNWM